MNENIDFRIRRFLMRLIMGHYRLEKLEDRYNKNMLNEAVEKMYSNLNSYVNETMVQATSKVTREMLVQIIMKSEILTELQKAQITSIIESASQRNSSQAYLG